MSAYRHPDRRVGKTELTAVIKTISHGVPAGLPELSRSIVLASSRSKRQMIQRMGRVRRKDDGRIARVAIVYVEGTEHTKTSWRPF